MSEESVASSELQALPSFEAQRVETRRKKVLRFITKQIEAGLKTTSVGEHGDRQFEFAEILERLPTEDDRRALIQMRSARTAPSSAATPAKPPVAATTMSAEELTAFEEQWEGSSDKSRARAERHVSYVREVLELRRDLGETGRPDHHLNQACKTIAARHGACWFTILRAFRKIEGQPVELWPFFLLDKNRGRSRREYGREWDRYFRSYYLVATAPAASVSLDLACRSITKMTDARSARLAGLRVPTVRALLDRLHSELSGESILLARRGADAVAARHYQDRDYSALSAGEALNGDGHRCDWWVKWPDGHRGRPVLFAFQCLFSGAVTGWRVDRTENQDLVRLAAADAFRRSLPAVLYLDNGRGGASKWLTGGVGLGRRFRFKVRVEDAVGIFRLLGIDLRFTNPYSGRSKRIERFWRDLESALRARPELRLAYAGNGKDQPAENCSAQAVPIEDFIRVLGEEIASYNSRGHDTPIAKGNSCDQMWDLSVASGAVLHRATEAQLRLLLLAAEKVRVHAKDASIHLFGNRYNSAVTDELAGKDIIVRFDPERLQDALYLYDREGRALGSAQCVSPTGFADHAAARETARLNKVRKRALRTELEAQDLIDRIELAGTLPQIEPPVRAAGKVVRPFRSPIEAPRETESEVFDSTIESDDEQVA